jgi:hypothetical protein
MIPLRESIMSARCDSISQSVLRFVVGLARLSRAGRFCAPYMCDSRFLCIVVIKSQRLFFGCS